MTELRDIAVPLADVRPAPAEAIRPWSVARVILVALVCCGLVGLVSGFTVGFLFGFFRAALKLPENPSVLPLRLICTVMVIGAILLTVALLLARRTGNLSAALGNNPISHPLVIGIGAVLLFFYGVLASVTFMAILPSWMTFWAPVSGWVFGLFFFALAVLAPLAEELFFRGWMWAALRQHWGVWATAITTGVLFLAMHLENGLLTVILLVPMAVMLSVARAVGGSVRASVIMHCLYNVGVAGTLWLALLSSQT